MGLCIFYENFDIYVVFWNNFVDLLKFMSVLCMSVIFLYVLLMVSLFMMFFIEVMDVGGRDNFGVKFMEELLYVMCNWICENIFGVMIIWICDMCKLLGG